MTISFTPQSGALFISAQTIPDFSYKVNGTQIGQTIAGEDGKHYTCAWDFNGATVVCAEDASQRTITSSQLIADQVANGLEGIGYFVPAYGCLAVPNTPHFYVWAQDGGFLGGGDCHVGFIRYKINNTGAIVPDGGCQFVFASGPGGNRYFAMNPSGGNGTIWGANVVGNLCYVCCQIGAGNGPQAHNAPVMCAIPYVSTYDPTYLDWIAHFHDCTPELGASWWDTQTRQSLIPQAWEMETVACVVDNNDGTGSVLTYVGTADIVSSANTYQHALSAPTVVAFDFHFTPSGTGGTWTVGSPYNVTVSGITFPFLDTNKGRGGVSGSDADDYLSPSVLLIGGQTFMCMQRVFAEQAEWAPSYVGVRALMFSYVKGALTFANGTFEDSPYNPVTDFGYSGDVTLGTVSGYQAFVAGDEIWGVTQYGQNDQLVYSKLFFIKNPIGGSAFMIERMDNRIWTAAENTWCVDCGLTTPLPTPNAQLTASSATGAGIPTSITGLFGGQGYSPGTTAQINDPTGSGAGVTLTIASGIITGITFMGGANYTDPVLQFNDPAQSGQGAEATVILDNSMTFTADAAVFSSGNVGNVIRMGGGRAVITVYTDTQHVTANMLSPITATIPNSGGVPEIAASGDWSMAPQVTTIAGLNHLIGFTVTGIADGAPIPPQLVSTTGEITLLSPASLVTVGLAFTPQFQSLYLDHGNPTIQGQRKKIAAVTVRLDASGVDGIQGGSNQPDGAAQSPPRIEVPWTEMVTFKLPPGQNEPPFGTGIAPLWTGDVRVPIKGGFAKPGQVALQQRLPLPMNVLAVIPEGLEGDTPEQTYQPEQRQPRGGPQRR